MSGSLDLDPRIGTELLGYRIDAVVGRGGMGVVYRAYDLRLKRNVALKLVAPEYASDERFRERFLAETELAASLEHPDVVPIYDAGEVDEQLYLAMRFVEGTDLKRLLGAEAPLEAARALAIVSHVADALDTAHERGLVHRDVKPSNVLLDEREHPYLADFGLTRRLDDPGSPAAGLSVGTPAYVAPEQIRGDPVDGRADQYALACMLHECLTGEPPFRRPSEVALLFAHLEDEPPSLGTPLDSVLGKALAKDPGERYASCAGFVRAARDVLAPEGQLGGVRRRTLVLAGLAGVLAAAAAVSILAFGRGGGSRFVEAAAGNSVGFLDPKSNRLTADVAVGTNPTDIALGDGAVWATNTADGTVDRIDLATRTVRQTIRVGDGPDGIAFGYNAVWVANGLGDTVSRIDPRSNEVTQTIPVGVGPSGIATGRGAVWVVNGDDSTLTKIDARSGKPVKTWKTGGAGLFDVTLAAGAVWVTSPGDGNVLRIDPRTGDVLDAVAVGGGPGPIAATSSSLWVVKTFEGEVVRIDPVTSAVTASVPVGASASGIAATSGGVWVASDQEGSVSRIDPRTNVVTERTSIGASPTSVAVGPDGVFIAVRPAATAHRGGTVTFLNQGWFEFSGDDPALSFSYLLVLTNDGLTAFRRVGGADSAELVPDLAVSLPKPTAGGKSYTFRLRKGIRYSNGAAVRASDFKVAFERLFQLEPGPGFEYQAIVGADDCRPKRCDLRMGIEADDDAGTVTFRLARPDPHFLAKLAQPYAFPLPSGTPRRILDSRPPPATGPYMIAGFVPGKRVRLVRNPYFHEWSKAARPAGYPDEIVIRLDVSPPEQVRSIGRGNADVADLTNSGVANVRDLRARYGGRLHSLAGSVVVYTFLNTRRPPFDDRRARRALNYALDRDAIVQSVGGPDVASRSCQVLPANSPGYRPYCPYERDLVKAKRLAEASGTLGTPVVVWTRTSLAKFHVHVVRALRALGYSAKLKVIDDRAYYPELFKAAGEVQAGYMGFYGAYPSAGSFIEGVTNSVAEATGFSDKTVERAIARARELEETDPLAANELWARVDRMLTDQAPIAPMYNLRNLVLVSGRVRNFQYHPVGYTLLDQLWVR